MQIKHSALGSLDSYQHEKRINAMQHKKQPENPDEAKLKQACSEFESIFIQQIFKEMRKTKISTMTDGGMGEEIFKDMLYEEYSKMAAEKSSIGLAKIAYDYLSGQYGVKK